MKKAEELRGIPMTADKNVKTILVVDDESENRRVFREILTDLGYKVIDEPNGAFALSAIREGASIDLVVTDDRMPDMSGLEFVTSLRQALPSVPVIVVTAYAGIENYFRALSLGVFEYVNKPVGKREFERIVQAALHESGTN